MKETKSLSNSFRTIRTAAGLSWQASPMLTVLFLFISGISGIPATISIWAGKHIVDSLINSNGSITSQDFQTTLFFLSILFFTSLFTNLLATIRHLLNSKLWDILMNFAHEKLINKSLTLDLNFFESSELYSRYEKVRSQIENRLPSTMAIISEFFMLGTDVISVSMLLLNIHWILLPVALVINLPALIWGIGYSHRKHSLAGYRIPEAQKADYIRRLTTRKESIKEIKLNNLGQFLVSQYKAYFKRLIEENWGLAKKQFVGAFFSKSGVDLVHYSFYLYAVIRVFQKTLSVGDVVLFTGAFSRASSSLGSMLRQINSLYENSLFVADFDKFLSIEPLITDPANPLKLEPIRSIKFEGVWFKYKPELPFVLEDVSFEVGENENIALVGENGAGKTTIIKLLMRLYEVTDGAIQVNGKNIKLYRRSDLWREMATVFQDFVKFQFSVSDNIGFGDLNKLHDEDKIRIAARKAEAEEFISSLPKGYDTVLGSRFEEGTDLSLGQWQRIAIARAFMRESSVIILDEPTASLDAKAEYEIFKKFSELTQGKTTFLVSHRFSTVRLADRIIVIEHGKLLEQGSHLELMGIKGRYSEMFNLQAEGYK